MRSVCSPKAHDNIVIMRIATWNISGGHKMRSHNVFDYETGFQISYFANLLHKLSIDVACIQESQVGKKKSIAQLIAQFYDEYSVYETPMSESHIDKGYQLSLAILSKFPIRYAKSFQLPYPNFELSLPDGRPASRHEKYMQIASLEHLNIINLFNHPMEYLGHAYETKLGQIYTKELTDFLNEHIKLPLVLAGDFNTPNPAKTFSDTLDRFGLKDAVEQLDTKPQGGGHLDCIFYSNGLIAKEGHVVKTQTDHFLCWADIERQ
jgi:endonuclease/exonuclease/phosphatase family metal-dependent hydrolase